MLIEKYDYDTDVKVQREEAYHEGYKFGFLMGILNHLGRTEDAKKAEKDGEIRKALYREFNITDKEIQMLIESDKKTGTGSEEAS